ncbi:hypothetical protein [Kitasatospora sp. SC0581]|uniref:hypothetical protein n=1 Tax=Kitasatospora sp. SC0581 TaxID=3394360 RepID=UPI003A846E32
MLTYLEPSTESDHLPDAETVAEIEGIFSEVIYAPTACASPGEACEVDEDCCGTITLCALGFCLL